MFCFCILLMWINTIIINNIVITIKLLLSLITLNMNNKQFLQNFIWHFRWHLIIKNIPYLIFRKANNYLRIGKDLLSFRIFDSIQGFYLKNALLTIFVSIGKITTFAPVPMVNLPSQVMEESDITLYIHNTVLLHYESNCSSEQHNVCWCGIFGCVKSTKLLVLFLMANIVRN